jgi:hypothetical protein
MSDSERAVGDDVEHYRLLYREDGPNAQLV